MISHVFDTYSIPTILPDWALGSRLGQVTRLTLASRTSKKSNRYFEIESKRVASKGQQQQQQQQPSHAKPINLVFLDLRLPLIGLSAHHG